MLIVTEPTYSALHDFERVAQLAKHFDIPAVVCINKFDINLKIAKAIEKKASQKGLGLAGKIPYDIEVTKAQIAGQSIIEYSTKGLRNQITALWQSTLDLLTQSLSRRSG